ncbi:MAG TPA: helix-turn-helix domain-containing protein [Solirubrobacteraceae bacterium]
MSATSIRPSARDRLLEAALARFGAEDPVAVTLEDVRQTAGVSVGALYHHFADKAALLDELYLELTRQVQAEFLGVLRAHPDAEAGVRAVVRHYLRWVSRNRAGARVLLGHRPAGPELKQLNRRFFADVLAWWQTHVHYGALRELPLELIHALWLGPAQEYTRHWLGGHTRRAPSAVADVLADAAWNALEENAR